MLHCIAIYIIATMTTVLVSVAGVTGWLFVTTSDYWLTNIIGGGLLAFSFIAVTVAFAIARLTE